MGNFVASIQRPKPEHMALVVIFAIYAYLKLTNLDITIGDHGIYYCAAQLWTQGIIPYRDFFISHPPVHLLLPAMAIKLMGMNVTLLDTLPSILGILSSALFFCIVKKQMGSWVAVLACSLFLFSYSHLIHSSHLTGVNVTLFFLLLSLFLNDIEKTIAAGIVLSIAFLSGAYVAPAIFAILIATFFGKKSSFSKLTITFVVSTILLHVIAILIFGYAFIEQVYLYHFAKTGDANFFASKASVLRLVIGKNAPILFLAACGAASSPIALRAWQKGNGVMGRETFLLMRMSLIALVMYALFFTILQSIFSHYFLLMMPFVVIAAIFFLMQLAHWLHGIHKTLMCFCVLLILLLHVGFSLRDYGDNRERKRFDHLEEISTYIASAINKEDTIYGDFAIVPMLSLVSGRDIAAYEIDSSIMRFASGTSSLEDMIYKIEQDNIRFVISRSYKGIVIYPPFLNYLEKNYVLAKQFNKATPKEINIWRKR